ncbi:MAG: PKD domain-containing protein [Candidatus Pacebacteria bacterium]|nr:PKD domain-containing protein [Candidatus Paceibacterota bacterium]
MEQEREENKFFTYLCLGLGLGAALILVFKVFLAPKPILVPSLESLQTPVIVDWNLLRKPLAVNLPSLNVSLAVSPQATSINSSVDLTAEVKGVVQGPFIYKFDCQGDGNLELTTDPTLQKKYTAQKLCSFQQEGVYQAQVAVDGFFDYFKDGQEVKEKKNSQSKANITIGSANASPEFISCDVDSVEGTTQTNFKFSFSSQAQDPNGDEIQYEWDLGDGTKMAGQNIEYTYKQMGLYVPKVKAIDSKGAAAFCVAKSLTVLKGLSAFELTTEPTSIGRQDPFSVYKPGEQGLVVLGGIEATSSIAKKGTATSSTASATSTVSATSTKP